MNNFTIKLPQKIITILQSLKEKSINSIIVGGYVRDSILNIPSKDIDIELYNVSNIDTVIQTLQNFGTVNLVGKSFGVIKLSTDKYEIDFSLPRTESKIGTSHQDFKVTTYKNISFKEASLRRDFKMNSMGYDFTNKSLLDPHNGLQNIKDRVLDIIEKKRFSEDPLRLLRAIQFCARFNLTPSLQLIEISKEMIANKELSNLPKERVVLEFKKLFLKAHKPSIGLITLQKIGMLDFFSYFKEIYYHDNYSKLLAAVDKLSTFKTNSYTLYISLIGIVLSKNEKYTNIEALLDTFIEDKKSYHDTFLLISNYNKIVKINSDYELKKLAVDVNLQNIFYLYEALNSADKYIIDLKENAKKLNILNSSIKPIIQGRDLIYLGVKPSKEFAKILNNIYDAQLHNRFNSYEEGIAWTKNYIN